MGYPRGAVRMYPVDFSGPLSNMHTDYRRKTRRRNRK